jgi:hypothetical protein
MADPSPNAAASTTTRVITHGSGAARSCGRLRDCSPTNLVLGVLIAATAIGIVGYRVLGPGGRTLTALVAFGAFAALFTPRVRAGLSARRVLVVAGALLVVAVATPPRGSHDVWSYAAYGRMLSVHGANPFTHVPADFHLDALGRLVSKGWRHTGSVYGPGFVAIAGLGTAITGSSVLATRLFFQLLEAVALVLALGIVWRRTRDPVALAVVALNPALLAVVNGAHNDVLVGLALLAGTVLLLDDHPRRAGGVLALGALVKLAAILPAGALMLWAWRRRESRSAFLAAAAFTVTLLGAYALAGGTRALGPLLDATSHRSRASIWQFLARTIVHPLSAHGSHLTADLGPAALIAIAGVTAVVVFGCVLSRPRPDRHAPRSSGLIDATVVVVATTLVFLLGAAYTLPWYSAWALPVAALVWQRRIAVLMAAQAAIISLAYAAPIGLPGLFGQTFRFTIIEVVPMLWLVGLVYVAWSARSGRLEEPVGQLAV